MLGLVLAYAVQKIYCYITTGDSTLTILLHSLPFQNIYTLIINTKKINAATNYAGHDAGSSKMIVIKGGTVKSFFVRFITYLAIRFEIA